MSVPAAISPEASAPAALPVRAVLDNGLEILVLERPGAPLARMGIVFRAGATSQGTQTAGLFRMLEYALFRGRAENPGEPEPGGAIEALVAESISGGTRTDRIDFWFDIPPAQAGQGLDTLSYLFSGYLLESALSDPVSFESARNAAILGIQENSADPESVVEAAVTRKLFVKAPWRLDAAGPDYIVRNVKAEALRKLATTWLVPNNALLVVAGDIGADLVFEKAKLSFGAWPRAADPWKPPPAAFPKPGVPRPTMLAYPDPRVPAGEIRVEMRYRGPDPSSSPARSAAAILWSSLASRPEARFAQSLRKSMPKSVQVSDVTALYRPSRDASWISVSAVLALTGDMRVAADRLLTFKEAVRGTEMYAMKTNASYFTKTEYEEAHRMLEEGSEAALADPVSGAAMAADAWLEAGISWLADRPAAIAKAGAKELAAFADEYFMRNLEVITARMNPADYALAKKNLDMYGFEQVTVAKAFWWM